MKVFSVQVSRLKKEFANIYVEAPNQKALEAKLEKLERKLEENYSLDWHPDNEYNNDSDYVCYIEEEVPKEEVQNEDICIYWDQV
jgi:ribosome-associated translation inhibitor RaiA